MLQEVTDQRGARTARSENDNALGHAPKFGGTKGVAKEWVGILGTGLV